ncbi:MAG: 16S rRNA (cytosine(1402)-N(4))-methyltransferase RsmH [Acidobacteria bacterium]|nr:16S rRNA (cytosine(1402)-N(4))-methyltransferase RsmH [Acidobacteriota bacterium]
MNGTSAQPEHVSVLATEAVTTLLTHPDGVYVDGTVGLGGHAALIAAHLSVRGRLIAIDRDESALTSARQRLAGSDCRVDCFRENFKNLPLVLNRLGVSHIHGLLLDLGVSSFQLAEPQRGFSFQHEGPLDMRMDRQQKTTAADLVNSLPETELADLLYRFGEERRSRTIARAIVRQRARKRIQTTAELSALVREILGHRPGKIHPATRTFQALRIAVNDELGGLGDFIENILPSLVSGGRMVIISFHSLEDRIVKRAFARLAGRCICHKPVELCECPRREQVHLLTTRPITPGPKEQAANPRSRSAKMRAVEKR